MVLSPGVGKTTDNGTMVDNVFPIVRKDNERQRCLNFPKDNEDNGQRFLDFRTTDNVGQLSRFFLDIVVFYFFLDFLDIVVLDIVVFYFFWDFFLFFSFWAKESRDNVGFGHLDNIVWVVRLYTSNNEV